MADGKGMQHCWHAGIAAMWMVKNNPEPLQHNLWKWCIALWQKTRLSHCNMAGGTIGGECGTAGMLDCCNADSRKLAQSYCNMISGKRCNMVRGKGWATMLELVQAAGWVAHGLWGLKPRLDRGPLPNWPQLMCCALGQVQEWLDTEYSDS
ncbi:hypothetical protein EDD17DRAFT_1502582 [Pisolithus thermaeus]|nr:hypothetical protein EV401DRAFT_1881937 [Pisolithus croceorrhizus]KAI6169627.1 hypothetical protein EDD17DRAFT_1502582 [Pisolithus thermaeus]